MSACACGDIRERAHAQDVFRKLAQVRDRDIRERAHAQDRDVRERAHLLAVWSEGEFARLGHPDLLPVPEKLLPARGRCSGPGGN